MQCWLTHYICIIVTIYSQITNMECTGRIYLKIKKYFANNCILPGSNIKCRNMSNAAFKSLVCPCAYQSAEYSATTDLTICLFNFRICVLIVRIKLSISQDLNSNPAYLVHTGQATPTCSQSICQKLTAHMWACVNVFLASWSPICWQLSGVN
jgi:hypothetical protein